MASNAYDFGVVERLQASAVGLPGQRRFRLQFMNERGETANLWIEKEQLHELGHAVDQLLAQLSGDPFIDLVRVGEEEPEQSGPELEFPEPAAFEFRIGRLALGYDEGRARFMLLIRDVEDQGEPANIGFRCLVTKEQLQALSTQVEQLMASGRPLCPLCSAPLTEGMAHFCPPTNGHAEVDLES